MPAGLLKESVVRHKSHAADRMPAAHGGGAVERTALLAAAAPQRAVAHAGQKIDDAGSTLPTWAAAIACYLAGAAPWPGRRC